MAAGAIDPVALLLGAVSRTSPSGSEGVVAGYLVDALGSFCRRAYVDEAGNAVGVWGTGPRQLWLLGHIDTVPGDITVRLVDGVLHGRGVVDAKGSFAAFIAAVAGLPEALSERLTVTLIGAVGEEAPGSVGARHAVASLPPPELVIIGEPSGWDALTLGYKGTMQVELVADEPARHSSVDAPTAAELVVSAYNAIRRLVDDSNEAGTDVLRGPVNPLQPHQPTGPRFDHVQLRLLDVRSTSDGLTDSAYARLGFRLPPTRGPQELSDLVRALSEPLGVRCFVVDGAVPAYRCGKDGVLPAAFRSAIRTAGGTPRHKLKTGTSDMNVVAAVWGAEGRAVPPMIAYGPGDSSLDHTPDEHLAIEEYLLSIAVLADALAALAEGE